MSELPMALVAWYILGIWGYVYWERVTLNKPPNWCDAIALGALPGPFSWVIGWWLDRKHGNRGEQK